MVARSDPPVRVAQVLSYRARVVAAAISRWHRTPPACGGRKVLARCAELTDDRQAGVERRHRYRGPAATTDRKV